MGLREIAEADAGTILNDGAYGFGWPILLTNPAGQEAPLTGFSDDIAQVIDPDTGQAVSGRLASAVFHIADIYNCDFELPKGTRDTTTKPWLVKFDDINGKAYVFKVQQSNPDRALGIVVCLLEFYKDAY